MQITTLLERFEKQVRASKLRMTKTRKRIFEALSAEDVPLSVQEIALKIPEVHFVSVYRSTDALFKAGIIKQLTIGFKNKFELSDNFRPHHHHVTCENCGRSLSVQNPKIESLMKTITKQAGFKPTRHHFEAYGICKNCQARAYLRKTI